MWTDLIVPEMQSVLRVMLSAAAMYAAVLAMARWAGVRSFAELSTFDIAVTIAIGSMIANTVVSKDPPLIQGVVAVASLYAIQLFVSRIRHRFGAVEAAVDTAPILLMGPGGRICWDNMQTARVTEEDLRCHLREANVADPTNVQAMVMEGTGSIHVLHGHDGKLSEEAWILRGVRK